MEFQKEMGLEVNDIYRQIHTRTDFIGHKQKTITHSSKQNIEIQNMHGKEKTKQQFYLLNFFLRNGFGNIYKFNISMCICCIIIKEQYNRHFPSHIYGFINHLQKKC